MIEDDSSESGEEFEAPYWPANKLDAEGENVMSGGADPSLDAAARDELARLATQTRDAWNAYAAAPNTASGNDARVDYLALREDFKAACSPDVILALLAAAQRGEDDTRHDGLDDLAIHQRDGWNFYACKDVDPIVARLTATLAELADAATAAVREADRETVAFIRLRAAIRDARPATERRTAYMQSYVAEVRRVWVDFWKPKTGHRYANDFAAFLGERVLTDFDARAAARSATPTEGDDHA